MTLLPRRLVLAATLCSFSAQSTGAANFGPLAMPGAARLAFMAAAPAAVKRPPLARAAAEHPPLVEPLPYFVFLEDAFGDAVVEAFARAGEAWEDFKRLVGPDELPLKTVDLDEPAFISPAKKRDDVEAVRVLSPAAPLRPRAEAAPRALDQARLWLRRAAQAAALQQPRPAPRVPLYHVSSIRRLPSLVPGPWAFPLTRDRAGFAPLRGQGSAVLPRVEGRWFEAEGLRWRFVFLNPIGVSGFDAHGVSYTLADGVRVSPEEKIPERYWGSYPVYAHGQRVDYVVEVENVSHGEVEDLQVHARQEAFEPRGGAGEPLQKGARFLFGTLKAGERRAIRGWFDVMSVWEYHGSLEQTHAQLVAREDGRSRILADEPQAGIIDPPGDR